jgi:hypothetical protein
MRKFAETSSHIYGQPWDTLSFVIYTATGDLVNYIVDNNGKCQHRLLATLVLTNRSRCYPY